MNKQKIILIASVAIFYLSLALALQFSSPNISDPDAFYHITHAKIYLENGLTYSDFPWVQFSIIKDLKADIWYGFHILLIPFNFFTDKVFGIKLAGAIIAFLALFSFYWALKRLKIKAPILWPLMFMVSAPDVLYRLTMTRPHNLSFGLAMLTLSFSFVGSAWAIFAIAATNSFMHLALAWLPIAIVIIVSAVRKSQKLSVEWKNVLFVFLGSAVGLLLRPHPWEALKLFYIQVIQLSLVKLQKIPLIFGRELKPSDAIGFVRQILPVLFVVIIATIVFVKIKKRLPAENRKDWIIKTYSALFLTLIFAIITQFMMRRSYDLTNGFGVFALALITSAYFLYLENKKLDKRNPDPEKKSARIKKIIIYTVIILIAMFSVNSATLAYTYMKQAWSPTYLKDVSQWLKENTKPGDIIFNSRWDYFGGLFFWNQQNYYINGMDPIFMYAHSEPLYWESHFIAADVGYTNTCGKIRCVKEEIVPIQKALLNHFNSSYVMLRLIQNPKTYFYWLQEGKFPVVFDNKKEAIFKIPPL